MVKIYYNDVVTIYSCQFMLFTMFIRGQIKYDKKTVVIMMSFSEVPYIFKEIQKYLI
jgi:hypothetical protein